MRAEELMIGDWVYIHMNHNSDKYKEGDYIPNKVVGDLHPYRVTEEETISMVGIESNAHDDEFCIPIPLTKEILEKNGWKLIKSFYRLNANEGYDEWLVEVTFFDEGYFRVSAEYRTDEVLQADIYDVKLRYLHQFQHFLRLIGYEKDIVI